MTNECLSIGVSREFRYDAQMSNSYQNQIRQCGCGSAATSIRLLETIAVVAEFAQRTEDRAALLRHAEMIVRGARDNLSEAQDRRTVEHRYQTAIQLCSESGV